MTTERTLDRRPSFDERSRGFPIRALNDGLAIRSYTRVRVGWRSGMWDTDGDGYVHATGDVVGGHCVFLRGISTLHRAVLVQNSWGIEWGINGCALLSWDDLGALLDDQGEACIPVHRHRVGTLP
jgi:hypothetical protein